jgi:hypothetical protein
VASLARARTLLHRCEENEGSQSGWCRPRIDAAGLRWAVTQAARERGIEGQDGLAELNSAHGQ